MSRFEGRRAAVTGAAGFVGGATARRLRDEGAEVVGIDASPSLERRLEATGIEAVRADVTDRAALGGALAGADLVVHAAAHVREWGPMSEFVRVNVGGTAALLDAAEAASVDRVVHVSSVVVYGYEDPSEQNEDAFRRSCGIPYIDTKSASDRIASRRGAVVVRPGDVYGPGSVPWTIRPIELARAGRLALPGAGDGRMLPVYVDDLVEALLRAALAGRPGIPYTAWDGSAVGFAEYFGRLSALVGASAPRRLPRPLLDLAGAAAERWAALGGGQPPFTSRSATFIDRRGTASTQRIRAELDWGPRVALDEGLRRSVEWARTERLV